MIEVKKALHTQIREDPVHKVCGLMVNIHISHNEWLQLDNMMQDLNLDVEQAIEEALYAGLAVYNTRLRRIQG